MEEKKKFKGMNGFIIGIAVVTCLIIGVNVYAGVSGKGNIFFMIKNVFTHEEVTGADNLLTDREEGKLVEKTSKVDYIIPGTDERDGVFSLSLVAFSEDADIVWRYKATSYNVEGQFSPIDNLGVWNKELVWINKEGTIIALDYNTGKELWMNSEYESYSSYHTNDKNGNLYLYSTEKTFLFAVDKNGKTIKDLAIYSELTPRSGIGIDKMSVNYNNGRAEEIQILWTEAAGWTGEDYHRECQLTINLNTDKVESKVLNKIKIDEKTEYNPKVEIKETALTENNLVWANEDKTDAYKYVIKSAGPNIYVDDNRNVRINGQNIGYKLKMILRDEYTVYFVTEDNYLYDGYNNKLLSNFKVKEIWHYEGIDDGFARYRVVFEDNSEYILVFD